MKEAYIIVKKMSDEAGEDLARVKMAYYTAKEHNAPIEELAMLLRETKKSIDRLAVLMEVRGALLTAMTEQLITC